MVVRENKERYVCRNTSLNMIIKYIRSSQPDRIRILNIFVPPNLTKYEYRIYSLLATWLNTNIFITRKLSIRIQISNILNSPLHG